MISSVGATVNRDTQKSILYATEVVHTVVVETRGEAVTVTFWTTVETDTEEQ